MRTFRNEDRPTITVTACDKWTGFVIALALLSLDKENNRRYNVRAIVQNEINAEELRKRGAEVVKIDYNRQETIETALGGTQWLVFVAEMEDRCVDKARTLADAAKRVRVQNVVILSVLGTGDSDLETFRNFRDVEKALEGVADNWVTLRNAFFSQRFWHWVPILKERGVLALSIHDDSRFAPLNLDDLVLSLDNIMLEEDGRTKGGLDRKHHHSRYTLTGPELVTGPIIADIINVAIDEQGAVEFLAITPEELDRYLSSLSRDKQNYMSFEGRDRRNIKYPSPPAPNSHERRMILDVFEYVTQGKAAYISGDQRDITGVEPERLTYFFKEHRDSFRPEDEESGGSNRGMMMKMSSDRSNCNNTRGIARMDRMGRMSRRVRSRM